MGNRLYHSALILLLLSVSCRDGLQDCFRKAGKETTVLRYEGAFNALKVGDLFDVFLVQEPGRAGEIELRGPSDVIGGVLTRVENGKLLIRDENNCRWVRQLDKRLGVTVYIDSLVLIETVECASVYSREKLILSAFRIDHLSTGTIQLEYDAPKESVQVDHRAAGNLILSGSCGILVATLYESGPLTASALTTDIAFVYHYGLNRADVRATDLVECTLENTGDVYIHQKPNLPIVRYGRGTGLIFEAF